MMTRLMIRCLLCVVFAVLLACADPVFALEVHVFVEEEDGEAKQPVSNAGVSLWSPMPHGSARLVERTYSNERGIAVLPDVEGALLVVSAEGFLRFDLDLQEIRDRESASKTVDVSMQRGRSVRLLVRDEKDEVVPEFQYSLLPMASIVRDLPALYAGRTATRVEVDSAGHLDGNQSLDLEGFAVRRVVSDKGTATVEGLAADDLLLLVSAPGYGVASHLLAANDDQDVVVQVDRGRCRETTLVDEETENPLTGAISAPLPAFLEGEYGALWPVWPSGSDGRLMTGCVDEFLGLPHERVFSAPGYAPETLAQSAPIPEVLPLSRGATISGTALDQDDAPRAGHVVSVDVGGFYRTTMVDSAGAFSIASVPKGQANVRLIEPDTGFEVDRRNVAIDEARHFEISFGAGSSLPVRVLLGDDPWPDIAAALTGASDAGPVILMETATDDDGFFRMPLPSTEAGALALTFFDGAQSLSVPLPNAKRLARLADDLASGRNESVFTLRIEGRWIDGRVIDASSEDGIAKRRVSVMTESGAGCRGYSLGRDSLFWSADFDGILNFCSGFHVETSSDTKGRFRVFVPTRDKVFLWVTDPYGLDKGKSYAPYSRPLADFAAEEDETIIVRLTGKSEITVYVTGPAGEPLDDCRVTWRPVDSLSGQGRGQRRCNADGVAVITPTPGTPVFVIARAGDYAPQMAGPVSVEETESEEIRLALGPGGSLRILTRDLPVAQGRRYIPPGSLLDSSGRDWTYVNEPRIDADGAEVFYDLLPTGRWTLRLDGREERLRMEPGEKLVVNMTGAR